MQAEVIKPDELINFQVSTHFYTRIQQLLLWLVTSQDAEIINKANQDIINGLALDEWGSHYFTLLSLIQDIEESAKEQNKTTFIDVKQ